MGKTEGNEKYDLRIYIYITYIAQTADVTELKYTK